MDCRRRHPGVRHPRRKAGSPDGSGNHRRNAGTLQTLRDLYRESGRRAGQDPSKLKLAINSHGYVAETSRQAADEYYRPYVGMMNRIGRERGWSGMDRAQYDALRAPGGALHLGSPQEVIDKILAEYEIFANDRFLLHLSVGTLPHHKVLRAIEMFGTKVAPVVRRETSTGVTTAPA